MYKIDLTGLKFERLLVLNYSHSTKNHGSVWSCLCDCGKFSKVYSTSLTSGKTKSCGCLRIERANMKVVTHGKSSTTLYHRWEGMKYRCDNLSFPHYGARGIKYDESWSKFENFALDMGETFEEHLKLDRIDVNGNYSKENCRWIGDGLNSYNRRKQTNNSSGKTGVHWMKDRNCYYARIDKDGKAIHLGYFHNFEDAVAAREEAEILYYGCNKE